MFSEIFVLIKKFVCLFVVFTKFYSYFGIPFLIFYFYYVKGILAVAVVAYVFLLSLQLVSRKGLSRSLFTATKKWFGGSKVPEKSISEPKSTCGPL